MFNSNHYRKLEYQLKAEIQKNSTFQTSEILPISALLREFVNFFKDVAIQAMLQESELQVMEQGYLRWVSAISCYAHLGTQIKDNIKADFQDWVIFRDVTGVLEIEIFTRPFTNPHEDIIRIYLQDLGGWNDSPVKYGVRPTIV